MINVIQRNNVRQRVHNRIRAKMAGTAERPRLNVYRSLNHIYTQLIDDLNGVTIASASTMTPKGAGNGNARKAGGNVEAAKAVGKLIADVFRCPWPSLSPSKPSSRSYAWVKPAWVAAIAASLERAALRHRNSTGVSGEATSFNCCRNS